MKYRIFQNGVEINTIEAGQPFVSDYCQRNGYTFDETIDPEDVVPEPTQLDRVEAQVAYTAMMTGTTLEEAE